MAFRDKGDVFLPIRASCAYPGMFLPVSYENRLLVDGAITMEIPAQLARDLGATHVISVHLPAQSEAPAPRHVFEVVNRCFQILQERTEAQWRAASDLVITPDVRAVTWDGFESGKELVKAGALAAEAALSRIQAWLPRRSPGQNGTGILRPTPIAALRRDVL